MTSFFNFFFRVTRSLFCWLIRSLTNKTGYLLPAPINNCMLISAYVKLHVFLGEQYTLPKRQPLPQAFCVTSAKRHRSLPPVARVLLFFFSAERRLGTRQITKDSITGASSTLDKGEFRLRQRISLSTMQKILSRRTH